MKTVSVADANRHFSKILPEVQAGETVLVTSRGRPSPRFNPPGRLAPAEQEQAKQALLKRLRSQPAQNLITWIRDELYDGG